MAVQIQLVYLTSPTYAATVENQKGECRAKPTLPLVPQLNVAA